MRNKTTMTKAKDLKEEWYLFDAKGKVLGRLAVAVTRILRGKHQAHYVSYLNTGNKVVIINAASVAVTGDKEKEKVYRWHTGYPGGIKEITLDKLRVKDPTLIIRKAVWGMMPKTRQGKAQMKNLHIFTDEKHSFEGKKFQQLKEY